MVKLTKDEIASVKPLGFLYDKNTDDCFNARVITRNGRITADECSIIAEASKLYGSGHVTMTTRLTMEIQGVNYENIKPLQEYLAKHNLKTGGTGPTVRPILACKGTTCQYGLIDTFDLSEKIHERFFVGYGGIKLPFKIKIAVGGCPNKCVKPDLNDIGVMGQRIPHVDTSRCKGCKVCFVEMACPIKASKKEGDIVVYNSNECNHCGRCMNKCPFDTYYDYVDCYKIFIGGRWGKKTNKGKPLDTYFNNDQEVLSLIEKVILFYKKNAFNGERLADTIGRLGFDYLEKEVSANNLLDEKDEILS